MLRFGLASKFDLIHRSSLLFSCLELSAAGEVKKSLAFDNLDPSEKGATTYFFGLALSKLLAERFGNIAYLMHLDVYSKPNAYGTLIRPILASANSRPDLVGQDAQGNWTVVESKGRTGKVTQVDLLKGKMQADKLRRVNGKTPKLSVCSGAHFDFDKVLRGLWVSDVCPPNYIAVAGAVTTKLDSKIKSVGEQLDEPPKLDFETALETFTANILLTDYYFLVTDLIGFRVPKGTEPRLINVEDAQFVVANFLEATLTIGLYRPIYRITSKLTEENRGRDLTNDEVDLIRQATRDLLRLYLVLRDRKSSRSLGPDGILVQALTNEGEFR